MTQSGVPAAPNEMATPVLDFAPGSAAPPSVPAPSHAARRRTPSGRRGSRDLGPSSGRSSSVSRSARLYLRLSRIADSVLGPVWLLVAFLLTNFPATAEGFHEFLGLRVTVKNVLYLVGFTVVWRLLCTVWGLYNWNRVRLPRHELLRVVGACTSGSAIALVFPLISITGAFGVETVFAFWLGSCAVLTLVRAASRGFVLRSHQLVRDVVIVGTGPRALRLFAELRDHPDQGSRVVGFVDSVIWSPEQLPTGLFLGSLTQFEELIMRNAVDEVLIALPIKSRYEDVQQILQACQRVGVRAKYLADVFEHPQGQARFEGNDAVPGVAILFAPDDHRLLVKRGLDIVGAAVGLLLLSPVFLLSAVAIKLTSPGPVFFVQPRYGFNRRRFNMFKFRTMVNGADELQAQLEHLNEVQGPAFKIKEDPRVTNVGQWLRRTSVDELPQLLNVLRGEMSLVGPRPLPERDVHRFTESTLMRRFSVWPGLTCLWQISGRSETSFERWIELDLQYVEEWSLLLDLEILLRTVPAVVRGTGAT